MHLQFTGLILLPQTISHPSLPLPWEAKENSQSKQLPIKIYIPAFPEILKSLRFTSTFCDFCCCINHEFFCFVSTKIDGTAVLRSCCRSMFIGINNIPVKMWQKRNAFRQFWICAYFSSKLFSLPFMSPGNI